MVKVDIFGQEAHGHVLLLLPLLTTTINHTNALETRLYKVYTPTKNTQKISMTKV